MPVISVKSKFMERMALRGSNQPRPHVCPSVPRQALRGGTDEGLHQLPTTASRIGWNFMLACGSAEHPPCSKWAEELYVALTGKLR
jgi:hypothetical protein